MELLLDECIDRRLGRELIGHTSRDRNLSFQQNLSKYDIALLVLRAKTNKLEDLRPLVPSILSALQKIKPKQVLILGI